jgi:hypothetical protein
MSAQITEAKIHYIRLVFQEIDMKKLVEDSYSITSDEWKVIDHLIEKLESLPDYGGGVNIDYFEKYAASKGFPKPVIKDDEYEEEDEHEEDVVEKMDDQERWVLRTLLAYNRGYARSFTKFVKSSGVDVSEFKKLAHKYGYKITDYKPQIRGGQQRY